MILNVVDANGAPQQVSVPAPGTADDASGTISANLPLGGPLTYQVLLPAVVAGAVRAGWFVVNRGSHVMYVTEDGSVPSSTNPTAVLINPNSMFPPPGVAYPITQEAVNIAGTAAERYSCKVW